MIQNCNKYKVLELFLEDPIKGFKLREISRILKLGLPSVSNYIKELISEKLVIKKFSHGIPLIFSNRELELFKKFKISDYLIQLESSSLLSFLDKEFLFPTIILFGSSSKGEDIKESDIDLCIISSSKKDINLKKFEKVFKKEIQIFLFSEDSFPKLQKTNKELFNNIINGIVLRGLIRV